MKRAAYIIIVIVALAIGAYVFMNVWHSKPPRPMITADGKHVKAEQGTYCWAGFIKGECVDMISPPEIIAEHSTKPVKVSPGAEVKIEFAYKPDKHTLGANQWINRNESEGVSVHDNVFKIPKEKGVYIYDVHAAWDEGSSSYVFVIEVE